MALMCRHCGKEVRNMGGQLSASGVSVCGASPTKKHVAVTSPPYCIYCGKEVKSVAGYLSAGGVSSCMPSPDKKHALQ